MVEGLSKNEKGLMNMDKCGDCEGKGVIRVLNANGRKQ